METKSLLYGLIGFFMGGLLVSTAATSFDTASLETASSHNTTVSEMSMAEMTHMLKEKSGDDYDSAFISYMIEHHQSAVDMAKLSAENAKHDEIKKMSEDILAAQQKEINQMREWQREWGYTPHLEHSGMGH